MRLWSLHPRYLDARGLVALWREGLLAQRVLLGRTRGYRHHPQLARFRQTMNGVGAIATYLRAVAEEGRRRGYRFDETRIVNRHLRSRIPVTRGQINHEFRHLLQKLRVRDAALYERLRHAERIRLHPLFARVAGGIEHWEKAPPAPPARGSRR